jgi:hypothetical protein
LNRRTVLAFALLFFCFISIHNAHGAMVKLSLENLVAGADLIILGTVDCVQSERVEGKTVSFATVSVNLKIRGEPAGNQGKIVVRFPGGVVGDAGVKIEDSPDFKQGEAVLLFLQKIQNQPVYRTVGSSQGKFLMKDHMVVRENLPLDQFLERIQSIIRSSH